MVIDASPISDPLLVAGCGVVATVMGDKAGAFEAAATRFRNLTPVYIIQTAVMAERKQALQDEALGLSASAPIRCYVNDDRQQTERMAASRAVHPKPAIPLSASSGSKLLSKGCAIWVERLSRSGSPADRRS
jgi:hypothetical protein